MSKVDPNLIERKISVGHLKILVKDVAELERCREGENNLQQAYSAERGKLGRKIEELEDSVDKRMSSLFRSVFPADADAAIIIGGQLLVRTYDDEYDRLSVSVVPYVNFDEAMEDTK